MPRTTKELQQLVKQYLARQSGTKPDSSPIKTGFLSGGSVKKSDLGKKELAKRDALKARIKEIKSNLPQPVQTDRSVARARLSRNQGNPQIPTTPRPPITNQGPFPGGTNQGPRPGRPGQTPPTKPIPSRGTVSTVRSALPTNVSAVPNRGLQSRGNQATQVSALLRKKRMK